MVEKPLDGHSLSDLESKTLVELQAMAKSMEIKGIAGSRKRDLIQMMLESQTEKRAWNSQRAFWKPSPRDTVSSAARIPTTSPEPTTYTCHPLR